MTASCAQALMNPPSVENSFDNASLMLVNTSEAIKISTDFGVIFPDVPEIWKPIPQEDYDELASFFFEILPVLKDQPDIYKIPNINLEKNVGFVAGRNIWINDSNEGIVCACDTAEISSIGSHGYIIARRVVFSVEFNEQRTHRPIIDWVRFESLSEKAEVFGNGSIIKESKNQAKVHFRTGDNISEYTVHPTGGWIQVMRS